MVDYNLSEAENPLKIKIFNRDEINQMLELNAMAIQMVVQN